MKIAIIGAGSWGKAIYSIINSGAEKFYITRNSNESEMMKLKSSDLAFLCIPTSEISAFLDKNYSYLPKNICSCSKGVLILSEDGLFLSEYFDKNGFNFACLSGPNFASEVLQGIKTITTIASKHQNLRKEIVQNISGNKFCTEETEHVKAVEIFGICKNIIALCCGILDGHGVNGQAKKANFKALILTKLVQEMLRVVQSSGDDPSAFGLSCGIGDLFLTATSFESRNYTYGFNFAEHGTINSDGKTVEGLRSLMAIPILESIYKISLPVNKFLYNIFYHGKTVDEFLSIF